ncbi:MAG: hypothetical protein K8R44_04870 [Sulfurimonas sp.]|nr:hypothetical protein [Sulfurimonas sp.]
MQEFFGEYKAIIIFLHIISSVVWIGGMIAMRYAAHPSFMEIESPAKRLERISDALKRLFNIVLVFIFILAGTGAVLTIGYQLKYTEYHIYTHIKEGIWGVMAINYFIMMQRRKKVDKAILEGNFVLAKSQLELIGKFMVPLNIALGIIAIAIGAYLSSNL